MTTCAWPHAARSRRMWASRATFGRQGAFMKTRVSWVVLLILMTGLAVPAAAQQTATVSGAIMDSLSGDVVANALVILESPSFTRQVKAGSDGRFSIPQRAARPLSPGCPRRRLPALADGNHRPGDCAKRRYSDQSRAALQRSDVGQPGGTEPVRVVSGDQRARRPGADQGDRRARSARRSRTSRASRSAASGPGRRGRSSAVSTAIAC